MGDWYQVVKTIKGNQYRYLQQTYREGGRVHTRNRYLGRVDAGATSNPAGSPNKKTQAPAASAPLVQSPSDFGAAMLTQFDTPQWGKDAEAQLLGSAVSGGTTPGRSGDNRRPPARFDFNKPVAYDPQAKRRFHLHARRQLRELATALGLQSGDYELRSNQAGIAVSGEVTLHSDHLYVQVEQSVMGDNAGILFRSCQGRRDYTGGANNFAPLDLLNDPAELASRIRHAGLGSAPPVTTTNEKKERSPSATTRPSVDPEAYAKYRRAQQRYNDASTDEQFHQAKQELEEAIKGLQSSGLTEGQQAYIKDHPNIGTIDGEQFIPKTIEQLANDYKTPEAYIRALRIMQQPEEIAREFYTKYAIKTEADIAPVLRTIWAQQHVHHQKEEDAQQRRAPPAGSSGTAPSRLPGTGATQVEGASQNHSPRDVQAEITNTIIEAIETGRDTGTFQMPWQAIASEGLPVNAVTHQPYHGMNVLFLSFIAQQHKWPNHWASFQQWKERGASVRKGEHGVPIVFYSPVQIQDVEEDEEGNKKTVLKTIPIFRYSTVFNSAQVDNPPPVAPPPRDLVNSIEKAEQFITATNADIRYGGNEAYFSPGLDYIQMPKREAFTGTKTSSPTEAFYGVMLHELCHWTGGKNRLNRDTGKRFGDDAYAAEELIAEIGAAFTCAKLGITPELRADHVQYVASWLKILKEDKRAIFTASAAAAHAVEYLETLQPQT